MAEHILIIDDSIAISSLLAEEILPLGGYQVSTADSGEEGLAMLQEFRPDLILCDLEMPGMNGLDFLRELQQKGLDIPAIMMTAFGSEATATQALRLGVKDYIVKPFTTDEILTAIERALTERRLQARLDKAKTTLDEYQQVLVVLQAISQASAAGLEPEELLSRIILAAVYSGKAQGGFIARRTGSYGTARRTVPGDRLDVLVVANLPSWEGKQIELNSDGVLAKALSSGEVSRSGSSSGYWRHVPLIRQQAAIGLMSIVSKEEKMPAPAEYLLSALAGYAGYALENDQLRSELAVAMLRGKQPT
jgi:DNA-binding response OmpR family regulator